MLNSAPSATIETKILRAKKSLALIVLRCTMAARTGKTVWVRDPALAEDQVFIKGKVISESGDQVRSTAAARNKTLLAELCALTTLLSASLCRRSPSRQRTI